LKYYISIYLITVCQPSHTGHNSQHVVIGGIDTNLGSLGSLNGGVGEDKLEGGVINSGEVASSRGLMFLRAESKGVDVNTLIRVSGVGLVRLDPREVGTFTLREAVLAVKLELSGDDGVLSPAVHIQRGLREDECAGIRDTRVILVRARLLEGSNDGSRETSGVQGDLVASKIGLVVRIGGTVPVSSETSGDVLIHSTGILEQTTSINVSTGVSSNGSGASESVDSIWESIDGISVVEGLGTEDLEEESIASQRRAVVNVLVRLDNPDKLLNGVVKVELNLVRGRTNRLITSELELSNKVLVGVLGHSASLVSVQEHIVNIERSSNQRLIVSNGGRDRASNVVLSSRRIYVRILVAVQCGNSPQALINRADIKVNLDLVVLESNQRESKTGVGAKPELERHVKGGLRKSVTGSANLTGSQGVARGLNIRERGVSDEGKLGGVTNHLEVTSLLLRSHSELIPDVHPVTILTVNSLTTNLDLNLGNELLTGVIQPTGIDTSVLAGGVVSKTHKLVNLGQCNLEICSVSQVSVSGDDTLDSASKVGLAVKSLLNRFDGKVSVPSVSDLPESDLWVTS
jgi:hypothetical protein